MTAGVSTMAWDVRDWSQAHLARVEQALSDWVGRDAPADLGDAMRYAVLDGGKRLRPLLVLAAQEAVQGLPAAGLRAACSVELIHAYSLVHDDMPCMDNDVLRRGKPTVHVQYGEAGALLAGDALQALAFELLTPDDGSVPDAMQAVLCRLLARAAGSEGMAGGQAIDLASVGKALDEASLRRMHRLKTGALLQGSVLMGAACGATAPRWGWPSRWWTTSSMWWPIRPRWARRPARMRRRTSPPMSRCWAWSLRVRMLPSCCRRHWRRWRTAACPIRRRWQHWPTWW